MKFDVNDINIHGISIVDEPATGKDRTVKGFVSFNKDKVKTDIKFYRTKEERMLYGIVLSPYDIVEKNIKGEKVGIICYPEDIVEFSINFMDKGYHHNSSFNHEGGWLNGITICHSWIVNDNKCDTSIGLGLSPKKGEWIVGMKISKEINDEFIKTGIVNGFSIDGLFDNMIPVDEETYNRDRQAFQNEILFKSFKTSNFKMIFKNKKINKNNE